MDLEDEQIQGLVTMVEAAEVLADQLGIKVSVAIRPLFKAMQVITNAKDAEQRNSFLAVIPVPGPKH